MKELKDILLTVAQDLKISCLELHSFFFIYSYHTTNFNLSSTDPK